MEIAIGATELYKEYGTLKAVDGVSFTVDKGSIFGLLGPNGAGKTTTIRMLTGLITPTSGSAMILGYDIAKDPLQAKAHIGVVPEVSNIYDEMTARDNLLFSAELYGVYKTDRNKLVDELLEEVKLANRANDVVQGFSKGMKRRLTIACALIHQPDLLFLDEPTTGLDIQSARQLRDHIRQLNREGVTILLTTHYMEEADQLCDSIAMINKGKLITIDTPQNLKAHITGDNVVEVSFNYQIGENELTILKNVTEVHRLGDKYRLTFSGNDPVGTLVDFARSHQVEINSMNTLRPSLEDAFLKLTGVSPEDVRKDKEPSQRRNEG